MDFFHHLPIKKNNNLDPFSTIDIASLLTVPPLNPNLHNQLLEVISINSCNMDANNGYE